MSTNCSSCSRTFGSFEALQQHLRDSPAHDWICEYCDRSFDTDDALQQHLDNSTAHMPSCEDCNRRFSDDSAFQQHFRDSPAHYFECEDCGRCFDYESALQQHLRHCPRNTKSRTQIYKEYGGFYRFAFSHGLKPWNYEDIEEAKAIADGLRFGTQWVVSV
ncbi:hypothetical protein Q7P37_009227 [Cladosporium fusiforme]